MEVENQLSKNKVIRSDKGVEYDSSFEQFCLEYEIFYQITSLYSPQFNEIVKRKNKTQNEMINAMLISSRLS